MKIPVIGFSIMVAALVLFNVISSLPPPDRAATLAMREKKAAEFRDQQVEISRPCRDIGGTARFDSFWYYDGCTLPPATAK